MENQFTENKLEQLTTSKSTMTKGFIILVLTLLMLIPVPFILNLIEERQQFQENVVNDISNKWSGSQVIYGPFIQVNYNYLAKNEKGDPITVQGLAYASANENFITADVNNTIKKRNLYQVNVYDSKLSLQSKFPTYERILSEFSIMPENVNDVKIVFAIKDSKGYESNIVAKSGGVDYPLNFEDAIQIKNSVIPKDVPGVEPKNSNLNFLSKSINPQQFNFNSLKLDLKLKGSNSLQFLPSAVQTNVKLTSNWKDLKFDGFVIPTDSITVKNNISTVNWKVFQQNPLNGQFWKGNVDFDSYVFGVDFLQMNDHYDKTYRSTKYSILFIGLTFLAFFFIENKNNFNIHIVQYALVGFAVCINFVLLLSISEYLGFNYAYFISAFATLALITVFVNSFLQSWKYTLRISMILFLLYAFIYSVLQLKEHALLVGSIGLFIILGLIMYYSKNIEWNTKK